MSCERSKPAVRPGGHPDEMQSALLIDLLKDRIAHELGNRLGLLFGQVSIEDMPVGQNRIEIFDKAAVTRLPAQIISPNLQAKRE